MFQTIDQWDKFFLQYVLSGHTAFLDNFFLILTQLGNSSSVIIITVALAGWLIYKNKISTAKVLLLSVIGSALLGQILKHIIGRPRPEMALYRLDSFSFPSGHATSALALYGTIIYIVFKLIDSGLKRTAIIVCCGVMIFLIGFSRIYLGFHYLSDVLGGFVLAGVWLLLTLKFLKRK